MKKILTATLVLLTIAVTSCANKKDDAASKEGTETNNNQKTEDKK